MITKKNGEPSAKRLKREANIMYMFEENKNKELTVEDACEKYNALWPDDTGMDSNLISVIMKEMYSIGILHRERRKVKKNRSGRIETVSIFFYSPSRQYEAIKEEAKNLAEGDPDLEFIPDEMRNRIAFKPIEENTFEHAEKTSEMIEMIEKKKEETDDKNSIQNLFTSLTFSEAFDKIYREGARVVSGVSGYIYAMVDDEKKKGIVCSKNPNTIISRPSMEEMNGVWRVMDSPGTCPFCKSKVKFVEDSDGKRMYYMCTNGDCCARGPYATTPEEAVNKFNTRV